MSDNGYGNDREVPYTEEVTKAIVSFLRPGDVVNALFGVACAEIKKNGNFKLGGMLNLKLKKKPATPAKKGINPFTKEPCVFKAKPASKTVRALAMKKLKEALN